MGFLGSAVNWTKKAASPAVHKTITSTSATNWWEHQAGNAKDYVASGHIVDDFVGVSNTLMQGGFSMLGTAVQGTTGLLGDVSGGLGGAVGQGMEGIFGDNWQLVFYVMIAAGGAYAIRTLVR